MPRGSQKFSQTNFPDASIHESLGNLLSKFSQTNNLKAINKLHAHLLRTGIIFISYTLQTNLVYAHTISSQETNLQTLTKFFNSSILTHQVPFNSILSSFVRNKHPFVALQTLSFMHVNGVPIDTYALCSSLTASCVIRGVGFGKQIHTHVVKSGWGSSVFLGSALVDFYSKSMAVIDAAKVFDEIPLKNTVCANALLSAYSDAKMWVNGIELLRSMPGLNLCYDNWTFSMALSVCAGLNEIELGSQIHAKVIRTVHNPKTDVFLLSSLFDLYGKCGMVIKAMQVFSLAESPDVVLWTSMLNVYGKNGHHKEVIQLFEEMLTKKVEPDGVAFVTVISACGHTGLIDLGTEYFKSMSRDFGLNPSPEHYGCLVDLFCRAGELEKAWNVVKEMPTDASVSVWGALLSACSDHGHVNLGKFAARRALELDPTNTGIYVLSSNMYAKYGLWDEIGQLRELMLDKGLKKDIGHSWIEAYLYGKNGHHKEVSRQLFEEMLTKKVKLDGVAFCTVISTCGHTCPIDLGTEYFMSMSRDFGINPSPEHYGCLMDLFCRAGDLEKACNVVNEMPTSASVSVWGALLSACCDHGHVYVGKFTSGRALELDPTNTGIYVLLSNMYAKYGLRMKSDS